ncbi:MAG: histidine kinase [Alteromonadaceae bacterium]|nr:MAG: histidine kinase [Alteromonadaceae bacterium]
MTDNDLYSLIGSKLRDKIKQKQLEVPMLPEIASKVIRLTQDTETDSSQLAKLIQGDQTLAGHVMRVANSAAFSPNCSMISLQQATTRLGMKVIAEIALGASVNSTLFDTPGFEKHISYELNFSVAAGLWAKEVARACRKNVEAAFLGGLLHDIGKPVAIQAALDIAKNHDLKLEDRHILTIEKKYQRAIGAHVVKEWGMPKPVCMVVTYFDMPHEAHSSQNQTLTVVAGERLASHFLCEEREGNACTTTEELLNTPVFAALNLYQDEILELLEREDQVKASMEALSA